MALRKRRGVPLLASLTLLVGVLLVGVAKADAETVSPQVAAAAAAADTAAARAGKVGFFVFKKNHKNPAKSRLSWQEFRTFPNGRPPVLVYKKSWRAGSGNGSKNPCLIGQGWLPNGWYGGTFISGFNGDINGIVWHLDNKTCHNGTLRSALFIHSEMTPSGGQNCAVEPECWNGNGDYLSAGCVKVRPGHIKQAAKRYRAFYGNTAGSYKAQLLLVT